MDDASITGPSNSQARVADFDLGRRRRRRRGGGDRPACARSALLALSAATVIAGVGGVAAAHEVPATPAIAVPGTNW